MIAQGYSESRDDTPRIHGEFIKINEYSSDDEEAVRGRDNVIDRIRDLFKSLGTLFGSTKLGNDELALVAELVDGVNLSWELFSKVILEVLSEKVGVVMAFKIIQDGGRILWLDRDLDSGLRHLQKVCVSKLSSLDDLDDVIGERVYKFVLEDGLVDGFVRREKVQYRTDE